MSKHIAFINDVLDARYDSTINTTIPDDAIEVDDNIFYQTINEQDGVWSLVNGAVVKLQFPELTISTLKKNKRVEINRAFESSMQQITAGYPATETSSWLKQESEARAYIANSSAPTQLIDSLATARGIQKSELVTRIIAKSDLFAAASGQLIGKRQRLEDQLDALDESATASDVDAIYW